MSWGDPFWFPHSVLIKKMRAGGGLGPKPPTDGGRVAAEVIDKRELIRDANGREVTSETRVTVPLETDVSLGALVTVWPDQANVRREATVLKIGRDENPPPLPSHLILWLT